MLTKLYHCNSYELVGLNYIPENVLETDKHPSLLALCHSTHYTLLHNISFELFLVLYNCVTVAGTPAIMIEKCSRSTSSVVLVLDQPGIEYDVIDGYKVFYCAEEQKVHDDWVSTPSVWISERHVIVQAM